MSTRNPTRRTPSRAMIPDTLDELLDIQQDNLYPAKPDGYSPGAGTDLPSVATSLRDARLRRSRAIRLWIGAGFSFACAGACFLDAPLAVRLGLALVATVFWFPAARAAMSLAVIVAALAVPGCAFPTTFTYGFTKPGVTAERFRADLDAARLDAVESERTISEQTTRVLVLMKAKGYARTPNGEDPGEFVYIAPLR